MTRLAGKVLCVDDEPGIVRSLQWLLQKQFEVLTATSGAEALELVKQHDFDVVISDQRMPTMTGVEVLREVRKLSPRTMRILLTGYSDMQAIVRSVNESEVFRFINKPWNIAELPKVVAQAITIAKTQPVEAPAPEISEDAPIIANGERILVIDDDPEMGRAVSDLVGASAKVSFTRNLADAVGILNSEQVSVIVSETRVGTIDATRLVRLMKSKHPEIVTVMLTAESDADTITTLINQGQIYRFVPKPIRTGYLKLVLQSALRKHSALASDPALTFRHTVEATSAGAMESLISDVQLAAPQAETAAAAKSGGFMASLGAGFRRIFGAG
ncbi:serine/threonine protein kinase [Aromatoleum tolulyticum]|uniref:Serine/threonine protein kinase n=1 Tax=Aromatoleum tolulyticum TaxID=34027 RepID=A0A1N6N994_9RHOO|nr:response regulator [Aromatoleum tolulyticum]SIP88631.1 serine/threonine protein kinase [Aromatoleum tolulyticum]